MFDIIYVSSVAFVVLFVAVTIYYNYIRKKNDIPNPIAVENTVIEKEDSLANSPRYVVIQDLISKSVLRFNMDINEVGIDGFVWENMDKESRRVLVTIIVLYILEDNVDHSKLPINIYNMQSGNKVAEWSSNIAIIEGK